MSSESRVSGCSYPPETPNAYLGTGDFPACIEECCSSVDAGPAQVIRIGMELAMRPLPR